MNDKKALAVLTALLQKEFLIDEEREAVREAIGLLSWTKFVENKLEARQEKRKRGA